MLIGAYEMMIVSHRKYFQKVNALVMAVRVIGINLSFLFSETCLLIW